MFCSGDWDPKRVPPGSEDLDSLLDAAPSRLPRRPQRCFTGETPPAGSGLPFAPHPSSLAVVLADTSGRKFSNLWLGSYAWTSPYPRAICSSP